MVVANHHVIGLITVHFAYESAYAVYIDRAKCKLSFQLTLTNRQIIIATPSTIPGWNQPGEHSGHA